MGAILNSFKNILNSFKKFFVTFKNILNTFKRFFSYL